MSAGTMRGPRARAAVRRATAGVALATAAAALTPAVATAGTPAPQMAMARTLGAAFATVESAPAPLVAPRQSLTSVVTVENTAAAPLEDARVELRVTRRPLEDREALAAFLAGARTGMVTVGTTDVGDATTVTGPDGAPDPVHRLAAGASDTVSVTSRDARLPFAEDTWAVHGIDVSLRTGDGSTTLMTGAVTWVDAAVPTLTLATVATASGLSSRVGAVAPGTDLPGVTLAVDPTAMSDLDPLDVGTADREVLRLPAQDPDLLSIAHAQQPTLLEFALAASDTGVVAGAPWLAVAEVADRSTARLAARNDAMAMLVTGTPDATRPAVTPVKTAVTVAELPERELALLHPDPTLSAYVTARGGPAEGAVGAAVAAGALTAAEATGPVLLWTGDSWTPTGPDDVAALAALTSAPFVETLPLTELAADAGPTRTLRPVRRAGGDLDEATIAGLAAHLASLADLSLVAADPSLVLDPGGRTLLSPLARTVRGNDLARSLRASTAITAVDSTLEALHVAAGSDVNFIADEGNLPVTVVNGLDVDATVVVDMTSFSPNLQIRETPTVTIPAGSSLTVAIEVAAVSSANVQALTVLRNPEGTAIAPPVSMSVRVRADWGTAITAVFTAGLVVLLLMGVIRTVRRGRKETRTTEAPAAGDGEE